MLIGAGERPGDNAGTMPFPGWVTATKPETIAAGVTRAAKACPHQEAVEEAAVGEAVAEAAAVLVAAAEAAAGAVKNETIHLTAKFDGGMSDV
jgi:hypothetical protein